jgi:hypothetical protein
MKILLLSALLSFLLAGPALAAGPGRRSRLADPELAEPRPNLELQQLASQRTAYLADALHLRFAQARQLYGPTHEKLQQLCWLEDATPTTKAGAAARAAAKAEAEATYHRCLRQVLSASQYTALIRLESQRPALVATATSHR